MSTTALVRRSLLIVVLLGGLRPSGAAALDVTGKWLYGDSQLVSLADLVQSGSGLYVDLGPAGVLTGTIDGSGNFTADRSVAGCIEALGGTIVGDTRLVGNRVIGPQGGDCSFFESGGGAERCECNDGNTVGGDGCDARCQIEPCFTCSGSPSVCTPSPDGAPCDDRNVCTTGETCTAGVCGGGMPVTPCIDLTGQWAATGGFQSSVTITQVGTIVELDGTATSPARTVGTIDPVSGALAVSFGSGSVLCPILNTLTGTAAADGDSFTLSGTISEEGLSPTPPHMPECVSSSVTITATRATAATTTTTLPRLLSGQLLLLRDNPDPAKRKLTIKSKDPNLSLGLGVGSVDDPTGQGASVRVRTSAGCNGGPCDNLYSLPPFHWYRPASGGYAYKDKIALPAGGPFRTGKVKPGRLTLTAAGVPFVQDLAADPGPVDVAVTLGNLEMCFTFGGTTRFRTGSSFRATAAPTAGACPP